MLARKAKGFSLIEVFISLFILSAGLLGAAGIQLKGVQQTQSSYLRSQATIIAYDMADRMRANPVALANGDYHVPSRTTRHSGCLTTAGCTPSELADQDFYEWAGDGAASNSISQLLPSGSGVVCIDSTPGDGDSYQDNGCDNVGRVYAIKVWWTDDRSEENVAARTKQFVTTVSF
ncbi:type IV pilus modification protein PilV [Aliamphritea spongicola]|uniref:type IV pilus modification protein PilV n=1 Tax=Aliamphritea spongicola TaxID=707589 RepID=UPI00196B2626|nr:type IV pilus modification protein PilV [Aliamphritea spongicola]MBN3562485.1 type IV pilus modification protein PilV [Aliamphritea spongicola]